jgi:hypothetical protein
VALRRFTQPKTARVVDELWTKIEVMDHHRNRASRSAAVRKNTHKLND